MAVEKKTFLDIPFAMRSYAVEHGAKQDVLTKEWFVVGEVPLALLSFVPKKVRQASQEYGPSCPECGSYMIKRYRKADGSAFWGCSKFPLCKATVDWETDSIEHVESPIKRGLGLGADKSPTSKRKMDSSFLRTRWEKIVELAADKLGDAAKVEKWLETPHKALHWAKPIKVIGTAEGCDRVEQLLEALLSSG